MEEWKVIREFPDYSVSNEGRVRNERTDRIMALTLNQMGIVQVGLTKNSHYFKRAVAPLVAHAFIPRPFGPFDTPINLDGDRTNNFVENLMWRPRWFAVKYHKQFKQSFRHLNSHPIIDTKTGEIYTTEFDACVINGLLLDDLRHAIVNRTYVWPTYQIFEYVE
jgi:hypothetical protein